LLYAWYQKPLHSGFLMHSRSFFSKPHKWHFLINRFLAVFSRCNFNAAVNEGVNKMHAILLNNGYSLEEVNRALVLAVNKHNGTYHKREVAQPKDASEHNTHLVGQASLTQPSTRQLMGCNPLKIPFVSDAFCARVRKLVNDLNLPFRVIFMKSRQVRHLGVNPAPLKKCVGKCQICRILPQKLRCGLGNVVYEAACKLCGARYVGRTTRDLYSRLSQHKAELANVDTRGPLPCHAVEHGREASRIENFGFKVVARGRGKVDTNIKEALCIESRRPEINRKEELSLFV